MIGTSGSIFDAASIINHIGDLETLPVAIQCNRVDCREETERSAAAVLDNIIPAFDVHSLPRRD